MGELDVDRISGDIDPLLSGKAAGARVGDLAMVSRSLSDARTEVDETSTYHFYFCACRDVRSRCAWPWKSSLVQMEARYSGEIVSGKWRDVCCGGTRSEMYCMDDGV